MQPGALGLSGDCAGLPIVWGPPAGICFDMPMADTDVHELPDASSALLATLRLGDFAALVGTTTSGWGKVDLEPGNTGLVVVGYVDAASLNVNGPCGGLPVVP